MTSSNGSTGTRELGTIRLDEIGFQELNTAELSVISGGWSDSSGAEVVPTESLTVNLMGYNLKANVKR